MNKQRPEFFRSLPLLFLPFVFASIANATTVRRLELPDLVGQSEIIADVTVTATQSYWASPAGQAAIHTRVTFSLNSPPLKGQVSSPFVLDFLGGTLGDRRTVVPNVPNFHLGERLLLFSYAPDKNYASPIIGLDQGALRVVTDRLTQVDRVYRWWGQPVNEAESFTSRKPITPQSTSPERLRTASSVQDFTQRMSRLISP